MQARGKKKKGYSRAEEGGMTRMLKPKSGGREGQARSGDERRLPCLSAASAGRGEGGEGLVLQPHHKATRRAAGGADGSCGSRRGGEGGDRQFSQSAGEGQAVQSVSRRRRRGGFGRKSQILVSPCCLATSSSIHPTWSPGSSRWGTCGGSGRPQQCRPAADGLRK